MLEDPAFSSWSENPEMDVVKVVNEEEDEVKRGGWLTGCLLSRFRGCRVPPDRSKRIDVVSRYLFPLVFAVFNLAYWTTYLMQARAEFEALSKIGSS